MMDLTLLKEYMDTFEITLSDEQLSLFNDYYEMIIERNKVMNLTSITDPKDFVTKHFIDSLSLVSVVDDIASSDYKIIDVGTGAGFPGIPLKIAFPDLNITLFDSLKKRILFLQEVIDTLDLSNISAIHGRAEDYGKNTDFREKYDICVSRAVANLSTLSEYCLPFVSVGGRFISYKTDSIDEEIMAAKKAISILGGEKYTVNKYKLYSTDAIRSLLIVNKEKSTPNKYPRKAPLPSKSPL